MQSFDSLRPNATWYQLRQTQYVQEYELFSSPYHTDIVAVQKNLWQLFVIARVIAWGRELES